ncbi:MnmC family methyltransferase [Methanobrevibacter boviskoreani]|uniref:MnmC family methyltransferase n=1 Tax=Methanobrevibacter boviskoreani TaxID=1348249 RepID=UPI0023A83F2E|nr:MnmC family methyltransferase [Methanobrevibacter boviskoreani]MCI6775132.1 MnmC family methyltransferase [Methanobrevibacter boviskoreani]MDY5614746.1 MnmC family methyltransferase [Methanobrevibacter boviskoreani]
MTYQDDAVVIDNDVFEIIKEAFDKEVETNDSKYRKNLFNQIKDYFVKTDDGSYSIKSRPINNKVETLHTKSGAISESFKKFIDPLKLDYSRDIAILDICAGLGYNTSAAVFDFMQHTDNTTSLKVDMVEISPETLACGMIVPSPIAEHDIVKKAIEDELVRSNFASLHLESFEIPDNIDISVFIEDARQTVQRLNDNTYDAIFLDPFSQTMAPELFTCDLFKEFKRVINDNGIVATYTSSAPVRGGFIEAGFHVGEGPVFGRFQGGTIASPNPETLGKSLNIHDERRIALSDVGIPFRDINLNGSSDEINQVRTEERHEKRHVSKISSAVKTPIFLGEDIDDAPLKRRVERNLAKVNIPGVKSDEAYYIIEPQKDYSEDSTLKNNSRDRILNMSKRLDDVINGRFKDN